MIQITVPSRTTNERHTVTIVGDRAVACTCKRYVFRKAPCAHMQQTTALLAVFSTEEPLTQRRDPAPTWTR